MTPACPVGYICNPNTKRCLRAAALDTDAPRVEAASVAESVGRKGSSFTLTLSVSEPLQEAPAVTFAGRSELLAMTLAEVFAPEATSFRFSYTARGAEVEAEGPNQLLARLVDRGGNVVQAAVGAALNFDFTAPEIVPGSAGVTLRYPPQPLLPVTAVTTGTGAGAVGEGSLRGDAHEAVGQQLEPLSCASGGRRM